MARPSQKTARHGNSPGQNRSRTRINLDKNLAPVTARGHASIALPNKSADITRRALYFSAHNALSNNMTSQYRPGEPNLGNGCAIAVAALKNNAQMAIAMVNDNFGMTLSVQHNPG